MADIRSQPADLFFGLRAVGLLLAVIGSVKAISHMFATAGTGALWCGTPPPNAAALEAALYGTATHCWGCPLALLGAAVMVVSALRTAQRPAAAAMTA